MYGTLVLISVERQRHKRLINGAHEIFSDMEGLCFYLIIHKKVMQDGKITKKKKTHTLIPAPQL